MTLYRTRIPIFQPASLSTHCLCSALTLGCPCARSPPPPASRPLLFLIRQITPTHTPTPCRLTFFSRSICCTTVVYSFTPHPYARTHAPRGAYFRTAYLHYSIIQLPPSRACSLTTPILYPRFSAIFPFLHRLHQHPRARLSTRQRRRRTPINRPPAVPVRCRPKSCILCYCSSELVMWAVISYHHRRSVFFVLCFCFLLLNIRIDYLVYGMLRWR